MLCVQVKKERAMHFCHGVPGRSSPTSHTVIALMRNIVVCQPKEKLSNTVGKYLK